MARARHMADSSWGEVDAFVGRHIGPSPVDQQRMLSTVGFQGWSSFLAAAVPDSILLEEPDAAAGLPDGCSEGQALADLRRIAALNAPLRSLIGLGYHGTITPAAIQRHVLENPCWYTSYTPYQAEIAQGRLEALLNFQTLISELTGLPIANASLLDEATAAAEAMALSLAAAGGKETRCFLVDDQVLPQTLEVLRTRAEPLGVIVRTASARQLAEADASADLADVLGLVLQLPGRDGLLIDPRPVIERLHAVGALVTVAIDPLTQVLLQPVGELGADIAIGSSQRLGVPMGFGGPHAAFFATGETHKRRIPGRLVGRSRDRAGQPALRLALQTREQHIRRDRATSNICTAQVLLAVMAGFYAVHHGPEGLEAIARRILQLRERLRLGLVQLGLSPSDEPGFDTVSLSSGQAPELLAAAQAAGFNLRPLPLGAPPQQARGLALSLDECSDLGELTALLNAFATALGRPPVGEEHLTGAGLDEQHLWPRLPMRQGPWLNQPVFHRHRNESDFVRYIHRLAARDFSLVQGMIPLGSCTMKLNAAAELAPVSWPEFSQLHPFAPADQSRGYARLTADLERWLAALTGFHSVSLQPNAGSQGEYAGLLVICAWHRQRGEGHRRVCLIPSSAHGTNPASAVMAGMQVVAVACDGEGNVDLEDLKQKAYLHANDLAAAMLTYPSTHGVFEPGIRQLCDLIHRHGGQVYLDGANLNAQVGLAQPGSYGADVCHLNLHKTFCIPHGGGGPGVGPIAVAEHLAPFLPGHELAPSCGGEEAIGAVSAAPWGSAGILPISWMYIRMMGGHGLRQASAVALLSANYVASRLADHYPVLFRGPSGLVAHECILDLRVLCKSAGLEVDDLAKRLMDYGFHAPTVSWPVAGTVMVEPTESEPLPELDRFCEAMARIRAEAAAIERGESDPECNPLRQSPHTLAAVTADEWDQPYSRAEAAYPMEGLRKNKHWPSVARIDNAYGDRHLICTCPSVGQLAETGQREPAPALAE